MAKYTVSNYPRDKLTRGTQAILDALAANPATANIGVKSGYRAPAHNAKVGGASKSQHIGGNALDLDIAGLSDATKKTALDTAVAAGAKGIGVYGSGNSLHVDPRKSPTVWGQLANAYKGMTKKQFDLLPDWARPTIEGLFKGITPSIPSLGFGELIGRNKEAVPSTMTRQQALNEIARENLAPTVAQAFNSPTRALDVAQPAALAGAPVGQVTRAALGPVSAPTAPRGAVYAGITAMDRALPSPADTMMASLAAKPSTAPRAAVDAAINGPLGLEAGAGALSASMDRNIAAMNAPAPAALSPENLAAQYGQYRTPTNYTNVRNAMLAQPVAPPAVAPPAPVTPPALAMPPAAVLAPVLAPPKTVKDYAVAEAVQAPAAPRATASDVYNGLADTALDNTGKNTVSRDAFGNTTVSNQFGATTAMTPGGYQSAYGSMSLPGISGPNASGLGSKLGGAVKGAIPGVAGSALGGLLGGPMGALLGAAIAKAATQPGGLLSGTKSFNTSAFGTINAAKPQGGGAFPGAPTGAWADRARAASGGGLDRSLSPGAAANIDAGRTGLY